MPVTGSGPPDAGPAPSTGTVRGLLDAAPGPLHPAASATLEAAVGQGWADPGARYAQGRQARSLLDLARGVLAEAMGVAPDELSLHASAEEALEVGLSGLRHARRRVGERIVASAVDRSVVLLQPGADAPVPVQRSGRVDLERYEAALEDAPAAVCVVQSANGEVGTRQPVEQVAALAADHGVPLLLDATASLGRDPVPAGVGSVLVADAASFGGPPLGLLAVRAGTRFSLPGARREAEQGRAWAPAWVPLALAAAEAWRQGAPGFADDADRARVLVDRLRAAAAGLPDVEVAGDSVDRLPHVVTFSALFADGEALIDELARHDLAVASGSACTSSRLEPSHVLAAMGVLTHGNLRVTLPLESVSPGREEDLDRLITQLPDTLAVVRAALGTDRL